MPAAWRRPSEEIQAGLRAWDRHPCCAQGRVQTRVRDLCSGQVPQDPELCCSSAMQKSSAWGAGTPRTPARDRLPVQGSGRELQQGQRSPCAVFHQLGSKPAPPHSPTGSHTADPDLRARQRDVRNSSYLRVLLPRDPVPSGRPGPQSESRPGPVYEKEKESLHSASIWALKTGQPHCHEI